MILSNGGHILHPDSNGKFVSQLNTENVKEAIQKVYDWYHVDKVASAFSSGQWTDMGNAFAQKKLAFIFGGHSDSGTAYSNLTADDYGVAYLPMGPRMNNYIAYITYEYSYVIPATYQNMTTELLLLADELHDWPVEDYTRDDEFRDEWSRYFHSAEQYNMWYNHHFSDKVQRVWDGSSIVGSGVGFSDIISGDKTPAVWVDTYHQAANKNASDVSGKYTYTGKLK
jgi:ABC-type glycerol-3-phosphate transport system substrate-binding protein